MACYMGNLFSIKLAVNKMYSKLSCTTITHVTDITIIWTLVFFVVLFIIKCSMAHMPHVINNSQLSITYIEHVA